jgi:hypothetical protein
MPRIRTIKPEFWTSPQVARVSYPARLLFIGTWNFADDHGNLPRDPEKLKMQVFPGDTIDVEPLVLSLIEHGLLNEYSVSDTGECFLHIPTFHKHQIINRPSKAVYPLPNKAFLDASPDKKKHDANSTTDGLTEGSWTERKGKEKEVNHRTNDGSGAHARACEDVSLAAAEISTALRAWERERGKMARGITASHPHVIELADLHVGTDELRHAYDAAVADRDATGDITAINAGFVRVFVDKHRNPPKKRNDSGWRRTPSGIERKASELGIVCPPGRDHAWLAEKCESVMRQRARANGAA